jgi:hypothetical protein
MTFRFFWGSGSADGDNPVGVSLLGVSLGFIVDHFVWSMACGDGGV